MKRALSLLLSIIMVLSSTVFAVPVMDTVESADEVVFVEETVTVESEKETTEKEETVKLQSTTAIQPGLNIFTGTADALTFDDQDISGFTSANTEFITRSGTNMALKLKTNTTEGNYSYISVNNFPVYTDADRPFKVKLDVYYQGQVRVMDNDVFDDTLRETASPVVIYKGTKNQWYSDLEYVIKGTQTASEGTGDFYTDDYCGDAFTNLIVYAYNSTTIVDNINITPYYKVTYDANGGSGTNVDYFLADSYTLKDGSAVTKAGYSFKGWSLTKDGSVVTSVTPTPGSDITLYAVWEKISVKPGINLWTDTTEPFDFQNYTVDATNKITSVDGGMNIASDTWIVTEEDLASDTDFEGATLDSTNKIIKLKGNYNHFTVIRDGMAVVEKDRPITVSFKIINNANTNIYLMRNKRDVTGTTNRLYEKTVTATTGWVDYSATVIGNTNVDGTSDILDGDANAYKVDGTNDVKSIYIMVPYSRTTSAGIWPVYMDDISVVPHYKVTYNANGGNGTVEPEYFLADSFTPNDGSALSKDGYVFMGWSLTENGAVVNTVTPTVGEDITLYAVWEEKATLKPGLNIFTGTTSAYTFDGTESDISGFYTDKAEVVTKEVETGDGNKALQFNTTSDKEADAQGYFGVKNFPVYDDADRPFNVKMDVYYTGQVRVMDNETLDYNLITKADTVVMYASSKNIWHNDKSYEIYGTMTANAGALGTQYTSDYSGDTFKNLLVYGYNTTTTVDNLSITPYYKVTYDANGATGTAAADYFLDGPYTALDDGSTLTKTGYNFKGWSLTKDGAVVTSVTPTAGEDITLYAVWEKAITTGSKPGLNMLNQESNAPLDFESYQTGSVPSMFLAGGATLVGVMEQPHSDSVNSSGKVLAMKRTGNYPALHFNIPEADRFEADRPVYLEFKRHKHYVPAADETFKNGSAFWVQKNTVDYMAKDIGGFTTAGSDWIQDKHLIDFSQAWKFETDEAYPNQLYNIILRGDSSQSNAGTLYICYDDMLYIPSYKLSYMVNDGTDAVSSYEYFLLPDDSTDNAPYKAGDTYTVNTADVAIPTRDGYAFMGWAKTPDATTPATEISFTLGNEDIALYAVWEKRAELKPGLNIFTGTTSAYTFDGTESDISGFYTNNTEVVTKEVETGDGNKALQLKTAGKGAENAQGYFAVKNFPVYTDADRPFDVKMDVYYTGQVRIMDKAVFDAALKEKADTVVIYKGDSNKWYTDLPTYKVYGTMTTSQGTGGHYSSDYYGDVFENLIVYGYNSNTIVDNLSITPYYKVTYDANGGTGTVAPAYFLDELTLNDGSALSKAGYNFKGWSLTKDGAVVTSVTPTAGEDITLYAVWETAITTGSKPGLNMLNQATNGGLDFESYLTGSCPAVITSGTSNLPISVMENMVKDSVNGTDKVIAVQSKASTETYPALWFNIPAADRFEADRPVFLSFKRMQHYVPTEANETFTAAGNFWINKNSNSTTIVTPNGFIANSTEKWYQDTYYFTGEQLTAGNSDALSAIILRNKAEKANPGIVYVCYDDINVIPAYKLNYMTNDGTDTVSSYEYFLLPDDSTDNAPYKAGDTYTVNTDGVAMPTRDGYVFVGWAKTPDATTPATEISFTLGNEDIALYAVWEKRAELKPGHNILTGTENAYTFDGTESDISGFYTDKAEVVTNEKTTGDGNKALQFNTTSDKEADAQGYFGVKNFPVYDDADRPFNVKMDVYYTGQVRVMDNETLDYNLITKADTVVMYASSKNIWHNDKSYEIYGTMTANAGALGTQYTSDYSGDTFKNLLVYGYNTTTTVDNLSITPYYKVTYDANGGTGTVAPAYFLNGGSLDDGSTLTRDGYVFIGWSMDKNATEYDAINTFTKYDENGSLLTGDVTLYAVWSQETTAKPGINLWTGTTEAATFEDGDVNLTRFEYTSNVSIKTETEKTGSDNNILSISKQNAQIDFKNFPVVEKERPIRIAFDYRYGGQVRLSVNAKNRYNGDDTDKTDEDGNVTYTGIHPDAIVIHSGKTDGAWYSLDTKIQGSVPGTFFKEPYANADIESLTLWAYSYNHLLAYDNIIMMPYYKVTYVDTLGAEVPETEWWIPTEDEPEFTVNDARLTKRGYNFLGWSYNGEVVTTFTPTVGEDIVLTAVWEEANADETLFKYEHTATGGIANGYITVVTTEADAAYTTATLYLANDSGVLSGFTAFGEIALTDGMGTYTVSGNRAFPSEATAIHLVLSGDGLTDKTAATYTIPTANRLTAETPLFTFWATSDLHYGGKSELWDTSVDNENDGIFDYWAEFPGLRKAAMNDIFSSDADFMFINGDVINGGATPYTDALTDYLNETLNQQGIPVFITNGNHEFWDKASSRYGLNGDADYAAICEVFGGQVDYIDNTYSDITITRDGDNLWYAADINGYKFIFMSTPEYAETGVSDTQHHTMTVSDAQLKFIEDQLYDGTKSNKTTFLVTHVAIGSLNNSSAIKAILAEHPNTIVYAGHSHSDLSTDKTHYTVVGDMTSQFTHINTGSLSYTNAYDGVGDSADSSAGEAGKWLGFATGQYVEVYENKVIVRARRFAEAGSKWFGHAMYVIETPGADVTLPDVSISGDAVLGSTLTALVDGNVPADNAGYTYEWIVDDKVVGTEKTYTVDSTVGGEYVRLRVYKDGAYASCNSAALMTTELKTIQAASIRTSTPQGMRYAGYVADVTKGKATVEEYGFIVAAEEYFTDGDYSELVFNEAGDKSANLGGTSYSYVAAAAYVNGGVDRSEKLTLTQALDNFSETALDGISEDGWYYSVVLTNIPDSHYQDAIVGKSYVKIDGVYYYGDAVVRSIYEMAEEYKAKYEAAGKEVPSYITTILGETTTESN